MLLRYLIHQGAGIELTGFLGYWTFWVAIRPNQYRTITSQVARDIAVGWAWLGFRTLALLTFLVGLFIIDSTPGRVLVLVVGTMLLVSLYARGPSWSVQKREIESLIQKAALDDDGFSEFAERARLFTVVTYFKGPTVDFLYFMARVAFITDQVLGPEYRRLLKEIDDTTNPETAGPLYRRAFELFREGKQRMRSNRDDYWHLVIIGGPSVREALSEEFIFFREEYEAVLHRLEEKHKGAGRLLEAKECTRRLEELANEEI